MADIHIVRHGDRWAVQEGPDDTPFFESYTREEAEAEARRHAGDGEIHWAEGDAAAADADAARPPEGGGARRGAGGTAAAPPPDAPRRPEGDDDAPSPDDLRPEGAPARPGE